MVTLSLEVAHSNNITNPYYYFAISRGVYTFCVPVFLGSGIMTSPLSLIYFSTKVKIVKR